MAVGNTPSSQTNGPLVTLSLLQGSIWPNCVPVSPASPPPRLDRVALSLLKLTYATEILPEHGDGLLSCSPWDPELLMGRSNKPVMSVFPEQCTMQKMLSGIFADLMSDRINTQWKEGGRKGKRDGGNEVGEGGQN